MSKIISNFFCQNIFLPFKILNANVAKCLFLEKYCFNICVLSFFSVTLKHFGKLGHFCALLFFFPLRNAIENFLCANSFDLQKAKNRKKRFPQIQSASILITQSIFACFTVDFLSLHYCMYKMQLLFSKCSILSSYCKIRY